MRVAHITPVFPPDRGGMGKVAFQQAQALAEAGMDVTVMAPRRRPPRAAPPGVRLIELQPLLAAGNAACLPQVPLRVGDYDVVHLHYPFFGTAELLAARRLLGGPPLVLQYEMDSVGQGWRALAFELHRRALLPLILRASDAVVVTTRDYAAASFLGTRLAALEDRLAVIPPSIELPSGLAGAESELARRHFGGSEGPVIFFLARLDRAHYFKGLLTLLEALQKLPELRLVVGGDGGLRRSYEAEAARLDLADRVRFAGDIPDELLPLYYASADVLVLPSHDRTEALGLVLLEAMACGTPVIASRLPGVRTLVADGRNGALAEPGNAADLAEKIALCVPNAAALGARARKIAAAWPKASDIADRLAALYRAVADGKPLPRGGPDWGLEAADGTSPSAAASVTATPR